MFDEPVFFLDVVLLQSLERQWTVFLDILGSYKQGLSVEYWSGSTALLVSMFA